LGIHGRVPLGQGDLHRSLVERGRFCSGIADENIQGAEFFLDLLEDSSDFVGPAEISLYEKSVGAQFAYRRERFLCGVSIAIVMNGNPGPFFRELQRDAPANSSRASRYERVFPLE